MKNTASIKSIIGLSQEETAMLFGITRSQWAMYASGKRDLPLAAKQLLASLIANRQHHKSVSKESAAILATEKKKANEWLQREYTIAQHRQQLIEGKIKAMENIRAECFAALEAVSFLKSQPNPNTSLLKSIQIRATNTLQKNSLPQLLDFQLKKETVEMLKLKIHKKIMPPEK